MDTNEFTVLKLFVVGILVNAWMMRGLSATDSFNIEPTPPLPKKVCNESRLQLEVEVCGEGFKRDMGHIDPQYWCNLTHFISLQEEGPQETLQQAATIIQKTWRRHVNREVFKYFKELISHCDQRDPRAILKAVNPREAELLDGAAGVFIRFRLGGITFPPNIYYKIFTYRPITDLCASSPRDYTQPGLKKPVPRQTNNGWPLMQEDRSGWYQRMENNSWRLFCSKAVPMSEPKEIEAKEKVDFHYSRLQRQQDVGKWRKKRKIEWLKQTYNQGRLQTHPVVNSAQEVMDAIEERGHEEVLDRELDELMAWTNTINFEEYM